MLESGKHTDGGTGCHDRASGLTGGRGESSSSRQSGRRGQPGRRGESRGQPRRQSGR